MIRYNGVTVYSRRAYKSGERIKAGKSRLFLPVHLSAKNPCFFRYSLLRFFFDLWHTTLTLTQSLLFSRRFAVGLAIRQRPIPRVRRLSKGKTSFARSNHVDGEHQRVRRRGGFGQIALQSKKFRGTHGE